MTILSKDIIIEIAAYLPLATLGQLASTSSQYCNIQPTIKQYYEQQNPEVMYRWLYSLKSTVKYIPDILWKSLYPPISNGGNAILRDRDCAISLPYKSPYCIRISCVVNVKEHTGRNLISAYLDVYNDSICILYGRGSWRYVEDPDELKYVRITCPKMIAQLFEMHIASSNR